MSGEGELSSSGPPREVVTIHLPEDDGELDLVPEVPEHVLRSKEVHDLDLGVLRSGFDPAGHRRTIGVDPSFVSDGTEGKRKKLLICSTCGKMFRKASHLEEHVRTHTGLRPFRCVICGKGFGQKNHLKKHLESHKVWPKRNDERLVAAEFHSALGSKGFKVSVSNACRTCDAAFEGVSELRAHLSAAHGERRRFECPECRERFDEVADYSGHTFSAHGMAVKRFGCRRCQVVFGEEGELFEHEKEGCSGGGGRPNRAFCRRCEVGFDTRKGLELHNLAVDHKIPCDRCQETFPSDRSLGRHLKEAHAGARATFECELCGKALRSEHYLRTHALIHTGQKPFACGTCDARFDRKDKLKRHALVHEARERIACPFRDNIGCQKTFSRMDKLKQHLKNHGK